MMARPAKRVANLFAELNDEILLRGLGAPAPPGIVVGTVNHLGSLVRRQRRVLGINQTQLAERASVGRRFVSELEAGKGTVRTAELMKVCAAAELVLAVTPCGPMHQHQAKPKTSKNAAEPDGV